MAPSPKWFLPKWILLNAIPAICFSTKGFWVQNKLGKYGIPCFPHGNPQHVLSIKSSEETCNKDSKYYGLFSKVNSLCFIFVWLPPTSWGIWILEIFWNMLIHAIPKWLTPFWRHSEALLAAHPEPPLCGAGGSPIKTLGSEQWRPTEFPCCSVKIPPQPSADSNPLSRAPVSPAPSFCWHHIET